MSGIAWVGFDMDYTLAIYDQPAMDELSIRATVNKLVLRGYPDFIVRIRSRPTFRCAACSSTSASGTS